MRTLPVARNIQESPFSRLRSLLFFNLFISFIWLHWVFNALYRLSLVALFAAVGGLLIAGTSSIAERRP